MIKFLAFLALLTAASGFAAAKLQPAFDDEDVLISDRIFGGQDAKVGQFPYMVSLRVFAKNKWNHVCGGSLITERWILTAAHCLRARTKEEIRVYADTITTTGDGAVYTPELLVMHENFSMSPVRADVGLIKLTGNVTLGATVRPIRLAADPVTEDEPAVASGWGFYRSGSTDTPVLLQFLEQTTLSNSDCADKVNSANLYDGNVCAFSRYGIGMCNGDSGSPLVANNRQIGVASWVKLPCASGRPDVYVRTSDYLNWISLIVANN